MRNGFQILLMVASSAILVSCAAATYTHSDKVTELVNAPLVVTSAGFVEYTGIWGGISAPNGDLQLYLYGDGSDVNLDREHFDRCHPESIAAYQADPRDWKLPMSERSKLARANGCSQTIVQVVPKGTKIKIDEIDYSYDFENGDRYSIEAHLLDPALSQQEFNISQYYFETIEHAKDGRMHLKPGYFAPANP